MSDQQVRVTVFDWETLVRESDPRPSQEKSYDMTGRDFYEPFNPNGVGIYEGGGS